MSDGWLVRRRTWLQVGRQVRPPTRDPWGMDDRTELQMMSDASFRALNEPGGMEILERMMAGQLSIPDGLAALLVLSGDYERRS